MDKDTRLFVAIFAGVLLLATLEGVTFWNSWFPPIPEPGHPFPAAVYLFDVFNVADKLAPDDRPAVNVSIRWSGWNGTRLWIDYVPQPPYSWFAPKEIMVNQNDRFTLLILKANMYARITFVGRHWLNETHFVDYDMTVRIRYDGSVTLGEWRYTER